MLTLVSDLEWELVCECVYVGKTDGSWYLVREQMVGSPREGAWPAALGVVSGCRRAKGWQGVLLEARWGETLLRVCGYVSALSGETPGVCAMLRC